MVKIKWVELSLENKYCYYLQNKIKKGLDKMKNIVYIK